MKTSSTILRKVTGRAGISACIASVALFPLVGSAATLQEVSTAIEQQVAAKPADASAILEKQLLALPEGERVRFAAGALAAALKGFGNNPDRALQLFAKAVALAPRAVVALMEVAHRAAPGKIVQITEIAIQQVKAAGLEELVPAIVARAVALAPESRAELVRVALGLVPPTLGERILDAVSRAIAGAETAPSASGLGGTINPANIGGSVVSPEQ